MWEGVKFQIVWSRKASLRNWHMSKDPKEVWGKSHIDSFKKIARNCGVSKCKGPEAEVWPVWPRPRAFWPRSRKGDSSSRMWGQRDKWWASQGTIRPWTFIPRVTVHNWVVRGRDKCDPAAVLRTDWRGQGRRQQDWLLGDWNNPGKRVRWLGL